MTPLGVIATGLKGESLRWFAHLYREVGV
eukprot:COSAG02_NODE_70908_length_193_cov_37.957447_1_plen_28_part_01